MKIKIYNGLKKTLTHYDCMCFNTTPQDCCDVVFQRQLVDKPSEGIKIRQVVKRENSHIVWSPESAGYRRSIARLRKDIKVCQYAIY